MRHEADEIRAEDEKAPPVLGALQGGRGRPRVRLPGARGAWKTEASYVYL